MSVEIMLIFGYLTGLWRVIFSYMRSELYSSNSKIFFSFLSAKFFKQLID